MKLKFAKATPDQHDTLYRLMQEAFTPYIKKLGGAPVAGPYPWLRAAIEQGDVYVALHDADIVGLVTTTRQGNELVIDQLGVDPDRQGEGIGSWILNELETVGRREQITILSMQTAEMMTDLLRLYARHGFQEIRKALPAHGDDNHLRVHLEKPL